MNDGTNLLNAELLEVWEDMVVSGHNPGQREWIQKLLNAQKAQFFKELKFCAKCAHHDPNGRPDYCHTLTEAQDSIEDLINKYGE